MVVQYVSIKVLSIMLKKPLYNFQQFCQHMSTFIIFCVVDNIVVGIILLGCLIAVTVSLIYGTILVCVCHISNVFNEQCRCMYL